MKNTPSGKTLPELLLRRLANSDQDWMVDSNCRDRDDLDMMSLTKGEMQDVCGPCLVRERCLEETPDSEELRPAGAWGNTWTSRKTAQED